jgi:hypothetical protein
MGTATDIIGAIAVIDPSFPFRGTGNVPLTSERSRIPLRRSLKRERRRCWAVADGSELADSAGLDRQIMASPEHIGGQQPG